jgi:hypothetical protein
MHHRHGSGTHRAPHRFAEAAEILVILSLEGVAGRASPTRRQCLGRLEASPPVFIGDEWLVILKINKTADAISSLPDQYSQHEPEVIIFGLLLLETQLPLRDFRNLSTCTIFCGGLSYGHRTT